MQVDFYHNLYNATFNIKNTLLKLIKVPAVLRLMILHAANILIPLNYYFDANKEDYSLSNGDKEKTEFIISLTSFPQRITKVHLVIESILRQTYYPSRIILWLSEEQFSSLDELPKKLLQLKKRGLEIYLTKGDLRSYKKYYFLLKQQPGVNFITIDDDMFYPSWIIENLINTYTKYPQAVCANRCAHIIPGKPYNQWRSVRGAALVPSYDLLPIGCGGVLYPANSLHSDVLNKSLFTKLCIDADDIWLNCSAFLNNTPIAYTGNNEHLLTVNLFGNVHLYTKNVGGSNNDRRILSVREYYKKEKNIDVFKRG